MQALDEDLEFGSRWDGVELSSQSVLTVSVIGLAYRAARTLRDLYGQLSIAMGQIAPAFEIIFLEDCGDDESESIITELTAAGRRLRGISA